METWIIITTIFAVGLALIVWTIILARRECEKGLEKKK